MFGIDDILLIGALGGAGMNVFGGMGQAREKKKAFEESITQERLRRQQMEYDSLREQRKVIRNAQMTQSVALSNQTAAGASTGISGRTGSAVGGAAGQTQGAAGTALENIHENLQIGEGLFASKMRQGFDLNAAQRFSGISALGSAISGLSTSGGLKNILGNVFGSGPSTDQPQTDIQQPDYSQWGYM